MINVYDSKETDFSKNGLIVLHECLSCMITDELNGTYELELEYPLDSRSKWSYLVEDNIIKADGQLFRIYYKGKTLNGIQVNARHIFYDLLDNFLEDVRPTNLSGVAALAYILTHTQYTHPFTSVSDVGGSYTKYFVRKNPVTAIMGEDGIIANWGGELKRDNFTIGLYNAIGLDRGILISYGKNIQGIEEALDTSGVVTRIMPVGKDGLLITEKYVDSSYINSYSHPKVKDVDFPDIETEAELRTAATNYFTETQCDIPLANYKIDFLELSKTEEYKNYAVLEKVYLGDTVTVKHTKLNINLKAKVIKTVENVLTGRLENIELGSFKPNLASSTNKEIQNRKKEIEQVKSDYQEAIDNATALITGSKGGNVIIHKDDTGKPYEILVMDTTDVNTAVNVWRWNSNGFGHSSTGYNGPFNTAITADGHILGAFITALQITGEQITAGIIKSKSGKWQLNLDGETINLGGKLVYDGTNLTVSNGTISGSTLRTSDTQNYMYVHDQNVDLFMGGVCKMRLGIYTFGGNQYPFISFGDNSNAVTYTTWMNGLRYWPSDGTANTSQDNGLMQLVGARLDIIAQNAVDEDGGHINIDGGSTTIWSHWAPMNLMADTINLQSDSRIAVALASGAPAIRLYNNYNGYTDNGILISATGEIDVKCSNVVKHVFKTDGTKTGGSIEIDGAWWGMSPVDSPRILIQDVIFDADINETGTVINLDSLFAKAINGYAVFPSNKNVEIVEKTAASFTVKGFTGKCDFNIIGRRIDHENYYFESMLKTEGDLNNGIQ